MAQSILITLALIASILAGETPACPFEAKVAAVHVMANRLEAGIPDAVCGDSDITCGWFARAKPTLDDYMAAQWFQSFDDPTDGALYFIGPGDGVQMPWLRELTGRWECNGTWVESWR